MNLLKKENMLQKSFFFSLMLCEVLKMISAAVKANLKQQACIFHLILVCNLSNLILSIKNRGVGVKVALRTKSNKCGKSFLLVVHEWAK